ncbi:MAG: molybdenum cofactor biosynthesis protein MoaE [Methanomicrobiales archaeon]|nr:molybdenum cofactor biosynthesis protein MoaE [Methanomicrobiales archaeon]
MPSGTIEIREEDFSVDAVLSELRDERAGAVVSFIGTVRGDRIEKMVLEAYPEVAVQELEKIREEAMDRFRILSLSVIHRIGTLSVGEKIVLIAAAAPHRHEAFLACEYAIDELKKRVPIWKKEIGPSGEVWVEGHRGISR